MRRPILSAASAALVIRRCTASPRGSPSSRPPEPPPIQPKEFSRRMSLRGRPKPGAQAASQHQAPPSRTAMPSTATRQANLFDPLLQVEAYSLKVAADWNFSGTVLPGPSCNRGGLCGTTSTRLRWRNGSP